MTETPVQPGRVRFLRAYFVALPAYLGALVLLVHTLWDHGSWGFLALTLAYYSLCCTFIPLPTTAIMVWLNVMDMDMLTVATVAAVGTTIANMTDYHVITFLMGYRGVKQAKDTKLYRVAVRWFERRPLVTLAVWNLIPFSLDVARWIACMRGYPRGPFMLGTFLGRWPRYMLIGTLTRLLGFDERVVAVLLALTVVAGVLRALAYLWHFWRQRRTLDDTAADEHEGAPRHEPVTVDSGPGEPARG